MRKHGSDQSLPIIRLAASPYGGALVGRGSFRVLPPPPASTPPKCTRFFPLLSISGISFFLCSDWLFSSRKGWGEMTRFALKIGQTSSDVAGRRSRGRADFLRDSGRGDKGRGTRLVSRRFLKKVSLFVKRVRVALGSSSSERFFCFSYFQFGRSSRICKRGVRSFINLLCIS